MELDEDFAGDEGDPSIDPATIVTLSDVSNGRPERPVLSDPRGVAVIAKAVGLDANDPAVVQQIVTAYNMGAAQVRGTGT